MRRYRLMKDMMLGVLVHASQMAYVEEAAGTHAILEDFTAIFRVLTQEDTLSALEEELACIETYLHLQTIRFPGRFDVIHGNNSFDREIVIRSGQLLEFVDQQLLPHLEDGEKHLQLELGIRDDGGSVYYVLISDEENRVISQAYLELENAV